MKETVKCEEEIKLLKNTVKAQARLIYNYRIGNSNAPEWVFKSLSKAKAVYGDDLEKIN